MAKKQKPEAATNEVAHITEPTGLEPTPKRQRRPKALSDVFASYLAALEERGSSSGTIASYRMELDLAARALEAETPLSTLIDTAVAAFFDSIPVQVTWMATRRTRTRETTKPRTGRIHGAWFG